MQLFCGFSKKIRVLWQVNDPDWVIWESNVYLRTGRACLNLNRYNSFYPSTTTSHFISVSLYAGIWISILFVFAQWEGTASCKHNGWGKLWFGIHIFYRFRKDDSDSVIYKLRGLLVTCLYCHSLIHFVCCIVQNKLFLCGIRLLRITLWFFYLINRCFQDITVIRHCCKCWIHCVDWSPPLQVC
jgi:hypothetical protein